jgi:DNA-binding IclR family transcriptional regulator
MLSAEGAADPVHVVLADLDPNLGQIVHLVGARDAHIVRVSQIRPAPAPALPAVRYPLIGGTHPRHRVALGALLLSRLAPRVLRPLRCRLRPSRKIITGRRHGALRMERDFAKKVATWFVKEQP